MSRAAIAASASARCRYWTTRTARLSTLEPVSNTICRPKRATGWPVGDKVRGRMATEVYAGRVEDYTDGRRVMVSINGRDVFVFERAGRFYAFENNCRHMGGPVGEGMLIGKVETILDENL